MTSVFCVERPPPVYVLSLPGTDDGVYEAQHQGPKNVPLSGSSGDSLEIVWPRAAPSFGEISQTPRWRYGNDPSLLPLGGAFKRSNCQLVCAVP